MVWQCGEVGGVISMKTFGLPRILSVLSLVPLSPYTFSVIHSCSFSIVSCLRDKALHVKGDTGSRVCRTQAAQPSASWLIEGSQSQVIAQATRSLGQPRPIRRGNRRAGTQAGLSGLGF